MQETLLEHVNWLRELSRGSLMLVFFPVYVPCAIYAAIGMTIHRSLWRSRVSDSMPGAERACMRVLRSHLGFTLLLAGAVLLAVAFTYISFLCVVHYQEYGTTRLPHQAVGGRGQRDTPYLWCAPIALIMTPVFMFYLVKGKIHAHRIG